MSTATVGELRVIPHCSQKKAEAIIQQRPYIGWKDLVSKIYILYDADHVTCHKGVRILSTSYFNAYIMVYLCDFEKPAGVQKVIFVAPNLKA